MRRLARTLRWPATVGATFCALLWLVGHYTAAALQFGNVSVGVGMDSLELGRGNVPFARRHDGWVAPQGIRIVIGPEHAWLPSKSSAQVWVSPAPAAPPTTTMTLRVRYMPLRSLTALLALMTLVVWVMASRRRRGHCPGCDYDLRGLAPARCPECGRPLAEAASAEPAGTQGA